MDGRLRSAHRARTWHATKCSVAARTVGEPARTAAGERAVNAGAAGGVEVGPPDNPVSATLPSMTSTFASALRRCSTFLLVLPLAACVVAPPRHYRAAPPPPPPRPVEQTLYFYPTRAQSEAQQDRDRYECYRWSVRETGVDPGMRPLRQSAQPATVPVERDPGATVGGAMAGAAVGGIVSSPRNVGTGLVLGAVIGGLLGTAAEESRAQAEERRQEARRDNWEARQAPVNDFRRAMSACMTGRGYSVR